MSEIQFVPKSLVRYKCEDSTTSKTIDVVEGQYFSGFLWAPSEKYWHNIIRVISSKYQITYTKKYKFASHKDLENLIIKLYKYDRVSMDKIKKFKIKNLMKYDPICFHFQFWVSHPENIKRHHDYAEPNVIKMKNDIRKKYKVHIDGYVRDIILHISDNNTQTGFVDAIIKHAIYHPKV